MHDYRNSTKHFATINRLLITLKYNNKDIFILMILLSIELNVAVRSALINLSSFFFI